jgi:glycosyltransferase involved in cell wall biosynthesis
MIDEEKIEVSFVMPCLNEAVTIRECVEECWEAIRAAEIEGEVVVADNGSGDGSVEIATRAGARVVPVADRGYGNALIAGIRAARGRYVVMGDSDMSYDFREMPRFWIGFGRGTIW